MVNKFQESKLSVTKFLDSIEDERTRDDCYELLKLMEQVTKEKPRIWAKKIVGFGKYHYKYDSGHEGDCGFAGFAPRKKNLTIYFLTGFSNFPELMKKLGKHTTGKSCLYINKLEDVDLKVLKQMIKESVSSLKKRVKEKGY